MKIEKFYNKKENREQFLARFQINNKPFRIVADSRKEVKDLADDIKAQERRSKFDLPVPEFSPLLKDLFDKYLASRSGSLKSYRLAKRSCEIFLGILGEDFEVRNLRTLHFQQFVDLRLKHVAPQTVHRELTSFVPALKRPELYFSELEGWLCPRLPKPKIKQSRRERLITAAEIEKLLEYLRRERGETEEHKVYFHRLRLADIFEFGLLTGMRRKEIASLKFADYDAQANSLRVIRHKTNTVSDFSPVPKRAVEIIESRKGVQGEYIFSPDGKPIESHYRTLKKIAKDLDLDYGQTATGFTMHDARHVFISNLIAKGVDIETVKQFSGHTDSKTLLRYTHSSREQKKRAIDLMDGTNRLEELTELYFGVKKGKISLAEFLKKVSEFC